MPSKARDSTGFNRRFGCGGNCDPHTTVEERRFQRRVGNPRPRRALAPVVALLAWEMFRQDRYRFEGASAETAHSLIGCTAPQSRHFVTGY